MTDRTLRRLMWASAVFIAVGGAVEITLGVLARPDEALFSALLLMFPVVGFVVLSRRPRATLGWLMVSMGFTAAIPFQAYGFYAIEARGGELPFGPLALALGGPMWIPFIAISGYLLLLFPDGHPPSPRWRWFSWACGIGLAIVAVGIWLYPGPFIDQGLPDVENPIGVDALKPYLDVLGVILLAAPLLVLGGAVALVVRLRRTNDDVVRHQIRWLAYAAALIATVFVLAFLPGAGNDEWSSWIQNLSAMSFMLIPIAIGIALLRYRLYDIDLVIRKTVVVALLVGFVAVVYLGIVAGIGALAGSTGNAPLSALAAAVVAILFPPVRARARRLADRIVYGKRATPYEVLTAFGGQLAGTYAAEDVLPRIARVLAEGVGAVRARVWLRVGDELRVVATWPQDAATDQPDDLTVPVLHTGEELGALSVAMSPTDPMDPTKEKLVHDLAAQAGLVLSNVRLTEELRARLDDLRAAQKRLVTAQDAERKRLERNIHDGAQQQLVALAVRLRLADALVDRDPAKAHAALAQLQSEAAQALDDLRDLARGIYPPLLADEGLGAALSAQARRASVPVEVEVELPGRFAPEIEAAVYFSCLEGLQNVAKYADASRATVRVWVDVQGLAFQVADDGRGFDPSSNGYGTGLQGIADRLAALDGTLEIESTPGTGTIIRGRLRSAAA